MAPIENLWYVIKAFNKGKFSEDMSEILNAEIPTGTTKKDFRLEKLEHIIEDPLKEIIPVLCNRIITKSKEYISQS